MPSVSDYCNRVKCCTYQGTYPCTTPPPPTYGCPSGDCCYKCIHPDDPYAPNGGGGCSPDCPQYPSGPKTCECVSMTCCAMVSHHPRLTPDCTCGPIQQEQRQCSRGYTSIKPRVEKYGDFTLLINQNSMVADLLPGTCGTSAPPPLSQIRGCNPTLNQLCACPSPYAPTIS